MLEVEKLNVAFDSEAGRLPVLRDVSFSVGRGERVALVGESGCGKSMTLMALTHLPPASHGHISGSIRFNGVELRGPHPKIAYIFQDPVASLDPVMRIDRQMAEAAGSRRPRSELAAALRAVDLREPDAVLRAFPCELSGGMCQRVMIAMALLRNPELLVADEPTTALDATTQADVMALLGRLVKERGMALLMATHNLALVRSEFETINVFYCGEIVESGPAKEITANPFHPYTKGLIAAIPRMSHSSAADLRDIPGEVPSPQEIEKNFKRPAGWSCAFAPRCPVAAPECFDSVPPRCTKRRA